MADDFKAIAVPCAGCGCLAFFIFFIILLSSIKVVEINQQLVFKDGQGKYVKNGPFTAVVWPHQRLLERREASRIGQREYAVIRDERKQTLRHHTEPGLVFLGPYEKLEGVKSKVVLQMNQYIRYIDKLSGFERVVNGPQVMIPKPLETAPKGVELCPIIGATNALLVENRSSGIRSMITQKGMFVPRAYEIILGQRDATLLEANQYAVVKDELSGMLNNKLGPQLLLLGPYEKMVRISTKVVLEKDEYYRLIARDGQERVIRGPNVVVPETGERNEDGKQKAVFITVQTAVIVQYRQTGQQRLETQPGVFYPGPYEVIKSVRSRTAVRANEAAVVRHSSGNVTVKSGEAFFLDPYSTIVQYAWSSYATPGTPEPVPKETITLIDLRIRRMFINTEVRTNDQVKLRVEAIVFWRVDDVSLMVTKTGDPPGDIAQRARTTLVQAVSGTTLASFMSDFNQVSATASEKAKTETFYTERGIRFEGLEVTRFDSVEAATALILQNIIAESTNRLNNLAKTETTNQINAAKMQANIELEKQRTNLIQKQAKNTELESQSTGESAGSKMLRAAQTFIGGLNTSVPDLNQRVELYQLQESLKSRNIDTSNLAMGSAQLFLAPKDLNLKLNMGGSPEL